MKLFPSSERGWPILWQIGLLLVGTQILANLVTGLVISGALTGKARGPIAVATDIAAPFVLLVKVLEKNGPDKISEAAHTATLADPRLSISTSFQPIADAQNLSEPGLALMTATRNGLDKNLTSKIGVSLDPKQQKTLSSDPVFSGYQIGLRFNATEWLVFTPSVEGVRQFIPAFTSTLNILMFVIPMLAAALWVSWAFVSPLAHLAKAADDFSQNLDVEPVVPKGSSEMRRVAASFNHMQRHIKTFVDARTRTIAAISHDLRTPLTRIRLRIESLTRGRVRDALIADVKVMEQLTSSVLAHMRDKNIKSEIQSYDIAILAQTVCAEFSDDGHSVVYDGPDYMVTKGDPTKIIRCFFNLIENSLKYGDAAKVSLKKGSREKIILEFSDHGPGIPHADRKILLEPFQRGDASGTTGYGLGLSIVRDIIQEHGGAIELADNKPKGLIVRLTLPS